MRVHVYPCAFTSVGVVIHVRLASFEQNVRIVLHFASTANKTKKKEAFLANCCSVFITIPLVFQLKRLGSK